MSSRLITHLVSYRQQAPAGPQPPLLLRLLRGVLSTAMWLLVGSALWIAGSAVVRHSAMGGAQVRTPRGSYTSSILVWRAT